jgi:hypothetical protein
MSRAEVASSEVLPRRFRFGPRTLVVWSRELTVGRCQGADVDLPMFGRLRSLQARISLVNGRHRLVPGAGTLVEVDNVLVPGDAEHILSHGNIIQFDDRGQCRWRYLQPVRGSSTATLEAVEPDIEPVRFPNGWNFRSVVLIADRVIVRRSLPAHIVWPGFPCEELSLQPERRGLLIHTAGASLSLEDQEIERIGNDILLTRLPSRLIVEPTAREEDWLAALILRPRTNDSLTIPIDPA